MLHCGKSIWKLGIMTKKGLNFDKMMYHFNNCPICRKAEDEDMEVVKRYLKEKKRKEESKP